MGRRDSIKRRLWSVELSAFCRRFVFRLAVSRFDAMCRSRRLWLALMVPVLGFPPMTVVGQPPQVPRTVEQLWSDFDPRKEPLDAKVVREWEKDGIVFRYVTYHIGTFKGVKARMAAFYGFPKGRKKLPGLLHFMAAASGPSCTRSSSTPSGATPASRSTGAGGRWRTPGRRPEYRLGGSRSDAAERTWLLQSPPGPKYLDPFESPRNNNWYC